MKKTIVLAAACFLTGLVSAKGPRVKILDEELLFSAKYASQYHAATIAETLEGDLVVACFGGSKEGASDVATWMISKKKGDKYWGMQRKILDPVKIDNDNYLGCYNPVLFQIPEEGGGDLLLFTKHGKNGSYGSCIGYLQRSADGGDTWSEREELGTLSTLGGADKNQPIMIGTRILAPSEGGGNPYSQKWQDHYEISDDYGKSWRRVDPQENSDIHVAQPSLLLMKDGSVRSYLRTRDGFMATRVSYDKGETWTAQEAMPIKNNNAGIATATLSDGRYVLVYDDNDYITPGRATGPRYPLVLAISEDGINWTTIKTLESPTRDGFHEFSYPSLITASNGDLLLVYTYCGIENDYSPRGNIKYMRLRIE